MRFEDRTDAGRQLASRLLSLRDQALVVLALPRGGVPVAAEIAAALDAPLGLLLVRKLAAPGNPELAIGAVVDGERAEIVRNDDVIRAVGASEAYLRAEAGRELAELERRRARYLGGHAPIDVRGRTVVVVDDGIATGATVRAALRALRRQQPRRVVLAVPVAAPEALALLVPEVDEVVCLSAPRDLGAIGAYYGSFDQVSDDAVVKLLERARARSQEHARSGHGACS